MIAHLWFSWTQWTAFLAAMLGLLMCWIRRKIPMRAIPIWPVIWGGNYGNVSEASSHVPVEETARHGRVASMAVDWLLIKAVARKLAAQLRGGVFLEGSANTSDAGLFRHVKFALI